MIYEKRIIVNVEAEPRKYYEESLEENELAFGIHLSFDFILGELIPEQQKQDEASAKDAVDEFIETASPDSKNVFNFYLYKMENGQSEATYVSKIEKLANTTQQDEWFCPLSTWLSKRGVTYSNSEVKSVLDDDEIDAADLKATHLLRISAAWDAPIAHQLGLTSLVRVSEKTVFPNPSTDEIFFIVPLKTVPVANNIISVVHVLGELYDLIIQSEEDGIVETVRTYALIKPDVTNNLVGSEGFLKVNKSDKINNAYYRVLKRFEERALSSLWVLPQLLEESDYYKEKKSTHQSSDLANLLKKYDMVPWFAAACASSALDPIIISLLMPEENSSGENSRVEGHVLSIFISIFFEELTSIPDEINFKQKLNKITSTQIIKWLRESIINNLEFIGKDFGNTKEIIIQIKKILALDDTDQLAVALVHYYEPEASKSDTTKLNAEGELTRLR